ncbi:hypothetical protein LMG28727_03683 [Paraburkholderia kirstenboschensis]|uniref:hypothetical protein n=1 Tax=Paraburkholderia kirstenboschensis TaxID=1245436 RepID=UPI000A9D15DE|nr:hypothetical protein [Paraburkholderia kirstenboschensis]CAD6539793.1 hypothetical protein LMG28727_03683 [Paraburkholderia kirstenboschensis]
MNIQNMRIISFLSLITCGLIGVVDCGSAHETLHYGNVKIYYDALLHPRCDLFLRHQVGDMEEGYRLGDKLAEENQADNFPQGYKYAPPSLCTKFRSSPDSAIIYRTKKSKENIYKKDLISLDEMTPWNGHPPFRVRFEITPANGVLDEDVDRPYFPYNPVNKISNYILINSQSQELSIKSGKKTGYRFFKFTDRCYLATEKKPRVYKYETLCVHAGGPAYALPSTVNTTSRPWINITSQNTVGQDWLMPASNVEIDGSSPVKPFIYSDFPINDNGRVTQGHAMCMADCAPGMLFRVLHKDESIWGASGKPPAPGAKVKPF